MLKKLIISLFTFFSITGCIAFADIEVSENSAVIGIGTTSTSNTLGVKGSAAVGSSTYTSRTAPANGAIIEGNVGIGTWNPTAQLEVSDSIKVGGNGNLAFNNSIILNSAVSNILAITGGNVGINSTTPMFNLDVLGTHRVTTSITTPTLALSGTGTINGLDSIDATGESTLESTLDIGGEVSSIGMASTVIADGVSVTAWNLGASAATTPAGGDNDTSIATTAYVQSEIGAISPGSGGWTHAGATIRPTTTTDAVGIGTTTVIGSAIFNVGGGHARIGIGGTNNNATSAGELYVQGDLEFDGSMYGDGTNVSNVNAVTGDSATSFFSSGTIERARGGLATDTSAFGAGIIGSDGSNNTIDIDNIAEIETAIGGTNIIASTEIDTLAELETLMSSINILSETEIDASSELEALMDDETGSGALMFGTAPTITTSLTMADAANLILNTTTGTKIGTSTSQKLGFFNATPVPQQSGDVATALQNLGLVTSATISGGGWTDGGTNVYATTTSDRVAIGTTTPTAGSKLQVVGTVSATSFVGDGSGLTGITVGGVLGNVVEDTTPQLGGDLDVNGKNIDFPSTANISDVLDEDNMASNSATKLATQQSIKAYVDTAISGVSGGSGGWTDGGTNIYPTLTSDQVAIGTTTPIATLMVNNTGTVDSFRVDDSQTDATPFIITSAGNVGIGTTSPASPFQFGTASASNFITMNTASAPAMAIRADSASTVDLLNIQSSSLSTGNAVDVSTSSTSQTVPVVSLSTSGSAPSVLLVQNSAAALASVVRFNDVASDTTPFSVDNTGKVGIGTFTPNAQLDIRNQDVTPFMINSGDTVTTGDYLIVQSDGNVGIGSVSPNSKLAVVGTVRATAFIGDGSGLTGISVGSVGWTDGGTNVYATTTSDNVAIGTITPTNKLTVAGTVSATAFVGDGSGLTGISGGSSGWTDGGTNIYTTTSTDTVGIGTFAPASGFKLDTRGNAYFSGNVGIGSTSPRGAIDVGPAGTIYAGNITGASGSIQSFAGNVGIGTTTASELLAVGTTGQFKITSAGVPTAPANAYDASTWNGSSRLTTEDAVRDKFESLSSSSGWTDGGTTLYNITSTDNVGIGTTTAQELLTIRSGDSDILLGSTTASAFSEIRFFDDSGNEAATFGKGGTSTSTPSELYFENITSGAPINFITSGSTTSFLATGVTKMTPTDTPGTCNSGLEGGVYADDSLNEPCYCTGSSWVQMDGGGAC